LRNLFKDVFLSIPRYNKKSGNEMSESTSNIQSLLELEKNHLMLLEQNPDDPELRISLAWCLLLEALHRAGQEYASDPKFIPPASSYRNSSELFRECLKQANTASDINPNSVVQEHLNQLEILVRMSNGEAVVETAADEQEQKTKKLVKDITNLPSSVSSRLSHKSLPK
jgi:hypothetical protein